MSQYKLFSFYLVIHPENEKYLKKIRKSIRSTFQCICIHIQLYLKVFVFE